MDPYAGWYIEDRSMYILYNVRLIMETILLMTHVPMKLRNIIKNEIFNNMQNESSE